MVAPAGLGQVDGLVVGPVLGDQLGANPEGPGPRDALDSDVPRLCDDVAVIAECELGRLLAEVSLAADGCVLLVEAPRYNILLRLKKQM